MHEIICPSCGSKYKVKPEQLARNLDADGQRKMRCSSCSRVFSVDPNIASDDLDLVVKDTTKDGEPDIGLPKQPTSEKPVDTSNPFERKDPQLDFRSSAQGRPKQPRKVGFVSNAHTSSKMSEQTTGQDESKPESPDPVLDRIRRQILEEDQQKNKPSRWLLSLLTICLFLFLLGAAIFWLLRNEPNWAKPSNWFTQTEDSIPLGKPKITNQKIVTRPTADESVNELDLAGLIENLEPNAIRLEQIRAIALNEDGEVLRSWTFSAGASTMAEGQVLPFSNKSPIAAGQREIIKFGWESDIARLPELTDQ